jgi:hypothetical protein
LHLKSYRKADSILKNIESLQDDRREYSRINSYHLSDKIKSEIHNDPNIGLEEKSERTRHIYYDIEAILSYFKKNAAAATTIERDTQYTFLHGVNMHRLYWKDVDGLHTIAMAPSKNIDALIPLVESEREASLEAFTRLQQNMDGLNILAHQFKTYIEKIFHEADRSTLRGRCKYENDQFPVRLLKAHAVTSTLYV